MSGCWRAMLVQAAGLEKLAVPLMPRHSRRDQLGQRVPPGLRANGPVVTGESMESQTVHVRPYFWY
jgi:hypothetical protein